MLCASQHDDLFQTRYIYFTWPILSFVATVFCFETNVEQR